ncbi:MAG: SIMPL domain-containing protein [Bacteroidia bacterium]|nr:SIMPL domain-containing protein [Bacteroidia bacterium]
MKKSILVLGLALSAGSFKIFSQSMGNSKYGETNKNNNHNYSYGRLNSPGNAVVTNNEEISITVNGLMNLVADNYVAIFSIVQVAETIEKADTLMNNRIGTFKQKLRKAGIDVSEIKTDMISFVPKYDIETEQKLFSKVYNEIPAGFELQKNVSVRFKNSDKLDDIMSAAAGSEIFDLVKVDYFIPNIQRSLDSLRKRCLMEYKTKLKDYEMIGFKLDTLKKTFADNFATTYPPNRY